MNILIVNDDGIDAVGIHKLAETAAKLGKVTVVAPKSQCSAMSQRITVYGELKVCKEEFDVCGAEAYSVTGTPADCVKVAVYYICDEKPDIVFSGINCGYNVGYDILYSGTVGAAYEALTHGIPAIAFSNDFSCNYEVTDKYLLTIMKNLTERMLSGELASNEIFNVNFPGCPLDEYRGIKENVTIAKQEFFHDNFIKRDLGNGNFSLEVKGVPTCEAEPQTDIDAMLNHYISISKVKNYII